MPLCSQIASITSRISAIPELLRSLGLVAETRVASVDEYGRRLREKLQEEVAEYLESESAEEIRSRTSFGWAMRLSGACG